MHSVESKRLSAHPRKRYSGAVAVIISVCVLGVIISWQPTPETRMRTDSTEAADVGAQNSSVPLATEPRIIPLIPAPRIGNERDIVLPLPPEADPAYIVRALSEGRRTHEYKHNDAIIGTWPPYEAVRSDLKREFQSLIDLETISGTELMDLARQFRETFWRKGGTSAHKSYKQGYVSRLLLETLCERNPDNDVAIDELIETISAMAPIWGYELDGSAKVRSEIYARVLLPLRLSQFRRMRDAPAAGRDLTWQDYVRGCDTVLLCAIDGRPKQAEDIARWLHVHIVDTGIVHEVYGEDLDSVVRRFASEGPSIAFAPRFSLYRSSAYESLDELVLFKDHYYRRRLPSFRGPNVIRRGVVPLVKGWSAIDIEGFRDDIRNDNLQTVGVYVPSGVRRSARADP